MIFWPFFNVFILSITKKKSINHTNSGALYANNNGLEKAIEDFEAALKVDAKHTNGRKYMCETLVAVARNYEDDKKVNPRHSYTKGRKSN